MAHDFASNHRRSQKKTKAKTKGKKASLPSPSAGTLLSVLAVVGFGLGLYFLAGVTLESTESPVVVKNKQIKTNTAIPSPTQERLSVDSKETEPTYTFYEKLKQMQSWDPGELVPIREPKEKKAEKKKVKSVARQYIKNPTSRSVTTSTPSGISSQKYILQAGSYGSFEDANNQRVKLIINGVRNTKITTVTLPTGKAGHRVEVGPFNSQQDLKRVKQQLARLKVNSFSRTVK